MLCAVTREGDVRGGKNKVLGFLVWKAVYESWVAVVEQLNT